MEEILSTVAPLWNKLNLSGLPHPFLTSKKRRHLSETAVNLKRKRSCEEVLASHLTDTDCEMDGVNEDMALFDSHKISSQKRQDLDKESTEIPFNCKDSDIWPSFVSSNFKQLQDSAHSDEMEFLNENGIDF